MLDIRHTVGHGDAFEGAGVRLPSGREHSAAARTTAAAQRAHAQYVSLYRQLNAKRRLGRSSKRNARV